MPKRKLADEPSRVGGLWRVMLPGGGHEDYRNRIDAGRAQEQAASEGFVLRQLRQVQRLWAAEFGAEARSKAAKMGHVSVSLTSLPVECLSLLFSQACDRCDSVACAR